MLELAFSIQDLEYFLLIMTRVSTFMFVAPFFGMSNTPNRVKIALAFFVSLLLYYSLEPVYPIYQTVMGYAAIVIKEAVTGLLIGWAAQLCTNIASLAGRLVDMESGLSMMSEYDPTTRQNTTITGMIYQYTIMLMLLVTGMYQYILKALVETFTLIPINGAILNPDKLLYAVLIFLRDFMVIGFRISLPVFASVMLIDSILGILAKVAPQMNMFAVGIQIKILSAFSVLFLTVAMLPGASDFIFAEIKKVTTLFVEAMM